MKGSEPAQTKDSATVTFTEESKKPRSFYAPRSLFDSWEVGDRYQLLEKLGRGSYGEVVKAVDRVNDGHVAIKQMKNVFEEATDARRAYREIHILRHLKHPSIVALLDVHCSSIDKAYVSMHRHALSSPGSLSPPVPRYLGHLYLVFEFMDTDLAKILKSNQYLAEEHVSYMLLQILDGLQYTHLTNVIHRDMKPANVLVNCGDCTVKIADFGLSRVVGSDLIVTNIDPEIISGGGSDAAMDTHGAEGTTSTAAAGGQVESDGDIPVPPVASSDGMGTSADGSKAPQILIHSTPATVSMKPTVPALPLEALPPPLPLKRNLTKHVITRWYRAPEVILLQPYTAAVDIWSVGCIFAELLGLLRENIPDYHKRRPLFPGESCGELSADDLVASYQRKRAAYGANMSALEVEEHREHQRLLQESYGDNKSQLSIIFDIIGTPSEEDLAQIDYETATFLRGLDRKEPADLKKRFPGANPQALDLLLLMLQFNPNKRITAMQALEHPFFEAVKAKDYVHSYRSKNRHLLEPDSDQSPGSVATSALRPVPLNVEIEKVDESSENLKKNIFEEVLYYRRRDLRATKDAKA